MYPGHADRTDATGQARYFPPEEIAALGLRGVPMFQHAPMFATRHDPMRRGPAAMMPIPPQLSAAAPAGPALGLPLQHLSHLVAAAQSPPSARAASQNRRGFGQYVAGAFADMAGAPISGGNSKVQWGEYKKDWVLGKYTLFFVAEDSSRPADARLVAVVRFAKALSFQSSVLSIAALLYCSLCFFLCTVRCACSSLQLTVLVPLYCLLFFVRPNGCLVMCCAPSPRGCLLPLYRSLLCARVSLNCLLCPVATACSMVASLVAPLPSPSMPAWLTPCHIGGTTSRPCVTSEARLLDRPVQLIVCCQCHRVRGAQLMSGSQCPRVRGAQRVSAVRGTVRGVQGFSKNKSGHYEYQSVKGAVPPFRGTNYGAVKRWIFDHFGAGAKLEGGMNARLPLLTESEVRMQIDMRVKRRGGDRRVGVSKRSGASCSRQLCFTLACLLACAHAACVASSTAAPPRSKSTLPPHHARQDTHLLELCELATPVEMPCLCCNTHRFATALTRSCRWCSSGAQASRL